MAISRTSPLRVAALATAVAAVAFAGCTTTAPNTTASSVTASSSLNRNVDAALSRLYSAVPESRDHVRTARAVLVCPDVVGGAFGIGVESGRCALRQAGHTTEYYRTTSLSAGWQAGAGSRALYYVFNSADAVNQFRSSNGWSAGTEAQVSLATMGANARVDTNTIQQPIVGYVLTNAGLQAGVNVQGNKFTKIDL